MTSFGPGRLNVSNRNGSSLDKTDVRCGVCECCSATGVVVTGTGNGADTDTFCAGQSIVVDNRHHGHHGFLDLLGTCRGRYHVGQQDESADACTGLPVPLLCGRLWSCESSRLCFEVLLMSQRYAVLLHRIQAPERASPPAAPPRPVTAPTPAPTAATDSADAPLVTPAEPAPPVTLRTERIRAYFEAHPGLRGGFLSSRMECSDVLVVLGIAAILIGFQFALMPSIVPFFLFLMFSFWIPQIWRNARRGSNDGMDKTFIIGTAIGRLALPLC